MILPLIKELTIIQANSSYPIDKLHTKSLENKIKLSNNLHSEVLIQEFDQQIQQNNNYFSKIYKIKTNQIKYHNFSKSSNILSLSQTNNSKIKEFSDNEYKNFSQMKCNKNHNKFSFDEDEQLKKMVNKHGAKNWKFISKQMPGRSQKQCRDRYINYLAPGINFSEWKEEEDQIIIEKYIMYGPKWTKISNFLPNRTPNSIKNRCKYSLKYKIEFAKFNTMNKNI